MAVKTMTLQEYMAALRAQGIEKVADTVVVCVVCGTPQSCEDFIAAGAGKDFCEVERYWGFSCIGRFLNSGSAFGGREQKKRKNTNPIGCDWTLGGLFHIHTLEVVDEEGRHHMKFEPASPEIAQAHFKDKESRLAIIRKIVEERK